MEKSTDSKPRKLSLKNKVEAVLFSVGARISLKDVCRLTRNKEDAVLDALYALQKDYEERNTALQLYNDGEYWKLATRDPYINVVRKIVTETELSKSVLETLAIIAFKYPIKQSELIALRTNKAYDHLKELEGTGFISRKKHGRSNLIKLTDKFFDYFDLPQDSLKDQFQSFESIASAIENKESQIKEMKQKQREQAAESVEDQEKRIQEEIDLLDEDGNAVPLEVIPGEPEEKKEKPEEETEPVFEQKLGNLQVYEEEQETEKTDEGAKESSEEEAASVEVYHHPNQENNSSDQRAEEENAESREQESEGIEVTSEMEAEIDKKVDQLTHPPKEEEEDEEDLEEEQEPEDTFSADDEFEEALEEAKEKRGEE